ncbi:MAG: mevalonate kinase [Myxococcales bacterium]|nr:mevalonate kinase [Myxococcales bacterium]
MSARLGTGAAPGKVILFGEHAVVYGQPAVAAAMSTGLGATVEPASGAPALRIPSWGRGGLEVRAGEAGPSSIARGFTRALEVLGLAGEPLAVTIEGDLPLGVGLGSSAAFAVSLLRALADYRAVPLGGAALLAAAAEVETVFHGTPSGLDHTVVTRGGCLRFARGETPAFRPVRLARPLPAVIAWSPREGSTRDAVEGLRARRDALPAAYDGLFAAMGAVAEAGVAALEAGDLATVGRLFDLNHGYLNACGVSSLANETMVALARRHGAVGAKLTGAGLGGAIIALCPDDAEGVATALVDAGFRAIVSRIG